MDIHGLVSMEILGCPWLTMDKSHVFHWGSMLHKRATNTLFIRYKGKFPPSLIKDHFGGGDKNIWKSYESALYLHHPLLWPTSCLKRGCVNG